MFLSSWLESFKRAVRFAPHMTGSRLRNRKSWQRPVQVGAERLEERALLVSNFSFPPLNGAVISPMLISHSSTFSGEPHYSTVATDVPTFLDSTEVRLFTSSFFFGGGSQVSAFVDPIAADITPFNDGFNVVRPLTNASGINLDVFQEVGTSLAFVRFSPGSALFGQTHITVTDGFNNLSIPVRLNDVPAVDPVANVAVKEDTPLVSIPLSGITAGGGADDPSNGGQNRLIYANTTNPFLSGIPTIQYDAASMDKIGTLIIHPVKGAPVAVTSSGDNVATITVTIEDAGVDNIVGKSYDPLTGDLTITNYDATLDNITRSVTFSFTILPVNNLPTIDDVHTATTTLSATNQVTDLTLAVNDASRFPPTAAPNFTIEVNNERMRVTKVVGSTFTVTRGVDGTAVSPHATGATVTLIDAVVINEDDLNGPTTVTLTGITAGGGSSPIGNEQQLVSVTPVATPTGFFTLTFDNGTHPFTTDLIPVDAPATDSRDETLNLSTTASGGTFTLSLANNQGAVTSLDDKIPNGTVTQFSVDDTIGFPTTTPFVISVGSSVVGTLTSSITAVATTLTLTNPTALPATPFTIQVEQEQMQVTGVVGNMLTVTRALNAVAHTGSLANPLNVIAMVAEEMLVTDVLITPVTGNPNHATLTVVRGIHGTTPTGHTDFASVIEQRTTKLNEPLDLATLPATPLFADVDNQFNLIVVQNGGLFPAVPTDSLVSDITILDSTLFLNDVTPFSTLAIPFNVLVGSEVMTVTNVDTINNTLTVDRAQNGTTIAAHLTLDAVTNPFTIRIDREEMLVTDVSGNILTVVRAVNGTAAAAHGNGFGAFPVVSQVDQLITVVDSSILPSAVPFGIRIGSEDMSVTGVYGNQLLVVRGIHGTTIATQLDQSQVSSLLTTGVIAYDATASDIYNALSALSQVGPTGVQVRFGPLGTSPVEIKFINSLGKLNLDNLTADKGGLTGNQIQRLQFSGLNFSGTGSFTLTFNGSQTGAIPFNADAATVQLALEALPNIGPGDIIVRGGAFPATAITVEFTGQYAHQNIPAITRNFTGLQNDERQQIDIIGGATGGTFRLTFTDQFNFVIPQQFTTVAINYDPNDAFATAQDIEAKLRVLELFLSGVTVTPVSTTQFIVTFSGAAGDLNQPPLTIPVNGNNLTPLGFARPFVSTLEDGNQSVTNTSFFQTPIINPNSLVTELVSGSLSIHDALVGLQSLTLADIKTSGTSLPGAAVLVEFTGVSAGQDVNLLTVNNSPLPLNGLTDFGGAASVTDDVNGDSVVDILDRHFDGELQKLSVIVVSDNADIVPDPIVNYISPSGNGTLRITNNSNRFGEANITITVFDSGFDQNLKTLGDNGVITKTIHVTVNPTNDLPTINPLPDISVPKNSSPINVSLKGITTGGNETQDLKVTATSSNHSLLADPSVVYSNGATTGVMTLTPVPGQLGSSVIIVTVEDAGVDGVLNTPADNGKRRIVFRFDVSESPTLGGTPAVITILEDANLQVLNLTGITAGGLENQPLQLLVSNTNTGLFTPANLNVGYASPANTATLNFRPTGQLSGSDTFHLTLTDGGPDGRLGTPTSLSANASAATALISVASTVALPLLPADKLAANINLASTTITLNDVTPFMPLTVPFKVQIGNEVLSVTNVDSINRILTVIRGEDGTDPVKHLQDDRVVQPFKIRIENETLRVTAITGSNLTVTRGIDGTTAASHLAQVVVVHPDSFDNLTITRDVPIQVTPVNDLPTLDTISPNPLSPSTLTISEGSGEQIVSLSGITDGEGAGARQHLKIVASSNNPLLTGLISVSYTDGDLAGSIRFTPTAGLSGSAVITVTVIDGGSDNNLSTLEADLSDQLTRMLNVTVVPIGDLPTLNLIPNKTINEDGVSPLTAAINNAQTSITVVDASVFSQATPYTIQVEAESMQVTAISGNTLTVTRAFGGTTAATHGAGVIVSPSVTLATTSLSGITDGDNNTQDLLVSVSTTDTNLISNLVLNYNPANLQPTTGGTPPTTGTVTFIPGADRFGSANVTVNVMDGGNDARLGIDKLFVPITTTNGTSVVVTNATRFPATAIPNFNIVIDNEVMTVTAIAGTTFTVVRGVNSTTPTLHSVGATVSAPNTVADNVTFSRTFTVTVNPTNDAPRVAAPPASILISEGAAPQTIPLTGIDSGPFESQNLSISVTSSNPTLIPNPTVSNFVAPTSGVPGSGSATINYQPLAFQSGTATLTVKIMDAGLDGLIGTLSDNATTTKTIIIQVGAVNDAPTVSAVAPVTVLEDSGAKVVSLSGITAGGGEAQILKVTASVISNPGMISAPVVTYTSPDSTGSLTFTPVANQFGTATIRVTVEDAGFDGVLATTGDNATSFRDITVNVTGTVDLPTLTQPPTATIFEDGAGGNTVLLTGITDGDLNTQQLQVTATSSNTSLVPNPVGVSFTQTPAPTSLPVNGVTHNATLTFNGLAAEQTGSSTITVTITDGGADGLIATVGDNQSITKTFTLIIAPFNDVPTINAIGTVNIAEPIFPATPGLQTINLSNITAGGGESQALTVTATSSNTAGIPNPTVTYASPNATGTLDFTPTQNAAGTFTITVTVRDAGFDTIPNNSDDAITTTTFNVVIAQGDDDAPVVDPITNAIVPISASPTLQTVNLTGIAPGPFETGPVSVSLVMFTNAGLFSVAPIVNHSTPSATGTVTFTPAANASGSSTVTLQISDGGPDNNLATLVGNNITTTTFTVHVVNPPTLIAIASPLNINEDKIGQVVNLTGISSGDGAGQPVQVTAIASDPALITNLVVNYADPSNLGSLSFDAGSNLSGTATITVTVTDGGPDNNLATTGDNATVSQTFTVVIAPDNDLPTLTQPAVLNLVEDDLATTINLAGITAGGGESQPLRVTAVSNNLLLIANPSVSYATPSAAGTLTLTPVGNASGSTTVTVTVEDGGLDNNLNTPGDNATFQRTFTVNVAARNDDPTLNSISTVTVNEDAPQTPVTLTGITAGLGGESQNLTITAVSDLTGVIPNPTIVYVQGQNTAVLKFTPVANASGTAHITVTVTDDNTLNGPARSVQQVFTINVTPVNDPPQFDLIAQPNPNEVTIDENVNGSILNGDVVMPIEYLDDTPLSGLTFSILSGNTNNAFRINVNQSTGDVDLVVNNASMVDFERASTFVLSVKVTDSGNLSDTRNFTIHLNDLAESLVINSNNWTGSGLILKRIGSQLHVRNSNDTADAMPAHEFVNVTDIVVNGRQLTADQLTLDYTSGDPIPDGGMTFNGQVGPSDVLRFANVPFINQLDVDFTTGAASATIVDPSATHDPISLTNVEGITIDTSANIAVVNLQYGTGNDTITVSDDAVVGNGLSQLVSASSPAVVFRSGSIVNVNAGDGADTVQVNSLDSTAGMNLNVFGENGNDLLTAALSSKPVSFFGGLGNNTLIGGSADDSLVGGDESDTLTGGLGNDTLDGGFGLDTLSETADLNLTLTDGSLSGLGADSLTGFEFALLTGGGSANTLNATGFSGTATLNGLGGNDTLIGGTGDDFLTGGLGDDSMDGTSGNDTLLEIGNVNFVLGVSTLTGLGTDHFTNIGFAFLTGGVSANTIIASAFLGETTLSGGDGNDTLTGSHQADVLQGGSGNDLLNGGDGDDTLLGDAGLDTLTGAGGTNELNGGADEDQVCESGDFNFVLTASALTYNIGSDALNSVETAKLIGGDGDNTIDASGYTGKATLMGGNGKDTLMGGSGADSIDGGAGNDTISGGLGNDKLVGGTGVDLLCELNVTLISMTASSMTGLGSDTLSGIENAKFVGTSGNDKISGGTFAGPITIDGLGGADSLTGGAGNDTLIGGEGNDTLNGLAGNDSMLGEAGSDVLLGGVGNDLMNGGTENDTMNGQGGNDKMVGGDGDDLMLGGGGNDDIAGQAGKDTIKGEAGADRLFGGSDDDSILGGTENDTIFGEGGNDILNGEAGTDVVVDTAGTSADQAVIASFAIDFNAIFAALLGP